MALQSDGSLIVEVTSWQHPEFFSAKAPFGVALAEDVDGYTTSTLFTVPNQDPTATQTFGLIEHLKAWLLKIPTTQRVVSASPWDDAHALAQSKRYAHYVEPNVLHERLVQAEHDHGRLFVPQYLPTTANSVSPVWHLEEPFTGFLSAWSEATGKDIWIAHLDTGYTPDHASRPRNLHPELGYDYWESKLEPLDVYNPPVPGLTPGHGTATLALLAGNKMQMVLGQKTYDGDFGAAPDAHVIPVRISPSVMHFYTHTMALGLMHALRQPNREDSHQCDVVTISHGGLPTQPWADAVNALYDAGVVIVAAAGDCYRIPGGTIVPSRHTVYPSAFNRVITAVGTTYDKKSYETNVLLAMQGSWGPDVVMNKAVAAYTPNVAWMDYRQPDGFYMDGAGTSSCTPQIAAACALWFQKYGIKFATKNWQRVEACRLALFAGAAITADTQPDPKLGYGPLNVPQMLSGKISDGAIAHATSATSKPSEEDSVSHPFWRIILGFGAPRSTQERMYETEVAQLIHQSTDASLLNAATSASTTDAKAAANMLRKETISRSLNAYLQSHGL